MLEFISHFKSNLILPILTLFQLIIFFFVECSEHLLEVSWLLSIAPPGATVQLQMVVQAALDSLLHLHGSLSSCDQLSKVSQIDINLVAAFAYNAFVYVYIDASIVEIN